MPTDLTREFDPHRCSDLDLTVLNTKENQRKKNLRLLATTLQRQGLLERGTPYQLILGAKVPIANWPRTLRTSLLGAFAELAPLWNVHRCRL